MIMPRMASPCFKQYERACHVPLAAPTPGRLAVSHDVLSYGRTACLPRDSPAGEAYRRQPSLCPHDGVFVPALRLSSTRQASFVWFVRDPLPAL